MNWNFDPNKFSNLPEYPDPSEWQNQTLDTRMRDLNQYGMEEGIRNLRENNTLYQISRALDNSIDPEPED